MEMRGVETVQTGKFPGACSAEADPELQAARTRPVEDAAVFLGLETSFDAAQGGPVAEVGTDLRPGAAWESGGNGVEDGVLFTQTEYGQGRNVVAACSAGAADALAAFSVTEDKSELALARGHVDESRNLITGDKCGMAAPEGKVEDLVFPEQSKTPRKDLGFEPGFQGNGVEDRQHGQVLERSYRGSGQCMHG
jgi:hypothetical protein